MPPDRHKSKPRSLRPAEGDGERLEALANATGQSEHSIIRQALTEYLDRHDHEGEQQR